MIFSSPEAHRQAFNDGLAQLLEKDSPGAFILVLANASFDPQLWEPLQARLRQHLERWHQRLRAQLAEGHEPEGAADDVAVMLRLLVLGFEHLSPTEFRHPGVWELQFNQLRAFRPQRAAGGAPQGLRRPFDASGFHFDKAFLDDEVFWQGSLNSRAAHLLYNKFPFVSQHGLLVPEPERHRSQWLEADDHAWLFALCEEIGQAIPGFGVGYNALGAQASVNHLHFQTFVRNQPLPVCAPEWRHNGGARDYPLACQGFDDAASAWRRIERLHKCEQPYNLLYTPGRCYCLPRRIQGSHPVPDWSGGLAWYETCGGFTTFRRDAFLSLGEQEISNLLRALSPDTTEAS